MSCKYTATVSQVNSYTTTVTQVNSYSTAVTCNLEIAIGVWILLTGSWNDSGVWIDGETWNDS